MLNNPVRCVFIALATCYAKTTCEKTNNLKPPTLVAKNLCDTCIEFPTNNTKITIGVFVFSIPAAKAGQEWAEQLYNVYNNKEHVSLYLFGMLKELEIGDATKMKRLALIGKRAKKCLYENFLRAHLEKEFHPYIHLHTNSQDRCAYQKYLQHTDPETFYTILLDGSGSEIARFSNAVDLSEVEQIVISSL